MPEVNFTLPIMSIAENTMPEVQKKYRDITTRVLERAIQIFDPKKVNEPLRLWEAYNELGSTYCDLGWLRLQQGDEKGADAAYQEAVNSLEKSVEIAQAHELHIQEADSCDDLAQVYRDWGRYEEAESWLGRVDVLIDPQYRLVEGLGFQEIEEPIDFCWVCLGKIHLQRSIWDYRSAQRPETADADREELLDNSMRNYALATAYFLKGSSRSPMTGVTSRSLARRFRTSEQLERLRTIVSQVAEDYRVDLSRALEALP